MTDGALTEYREKAGACEECGNSAVNHFETYCQQTFSVFTSEILRRINSRHLITVLDALLSRLEPLVCVALAALPLARFAHEPSGARTYRSQVIWEEAQSRGIPMEQLLFFGRSTEIYRARLNNRWRYFHSLPIPYDAISIASIIDDKDTLTQHLRQCGVAAPVSVSVRSLKEAQLIFSQFDGPVVVKPRSGSRGRHTTVNVKNSEELTKAFHSAQRLCRYVVIETYLDGSVCRATIVDGALVGFLQSYPPQVRGDGNSTIRELIDHANNHKPPRVQNIVINDEHISFLIRAGLALDTILPRGQTISLTHRTGRLLGGSTRELLTAVHPKLRDYVQRAGRAVKIPIVGFDLIINDPEKDPDEQRWGIIEGNSLPYIDLHYLPLKGTPSRVAVHVWDYVEAHIDEF